MNRLMKNEGTLKNRAKPGRAAKSPAGSFKVVTILVPFFLVLSLVAAEAQMVPGGSPPLQMRTWRSLDTGIDGEILALALYGDDLIAAGSFASAGGVAASNIARWDGHGWSPLGFGTNGTVAALILWNGTLVAAGDFSVAGGAAASNIARWNGSDWAALGAGTDGPVGALAVHEGELAVGGDFQNAGGAPARRVALWSGSAWSPLGVGIDGPVHALASFQGLVAGGAFLSAGSGPANNIARWDGSGWQPVGGVDLPVHALLVKGTRLYLGGDFTVAAGLPSEHIAVWTGSNWITFDSAVNGPIYALALFDGGVAFGGAFSRVNHSPSGNIGIRRNASWEIARPGTNGRVRALADYRQGLVAAGLFTEVDNGPVGRIARWACDPPEVPGSVSASRNQCGRVGVGWNDVDHELGYRIFRNGVRIGEVGADVVFYNDGGASVGTNRYTVLAWNGCGESDRSGSASGSPRRPPRRPGGLTASGGSCTTVRLSWGAAQGAANYRILRNGGPVVVLPATETAYEDHPPSGSHSYEVQSGNGCGWSQSVSATGTALPPPDPPPAVTASDSSCSIVRVDWGAVPGADGYRLFRDGDLIVTLPGSTLSHVDNPPPGAHGYALTAGGPCGWSSEATASGSVLPAAPSAPAAFAASDSSCSVVLLSWLPSAEAESYDLYRGEVLIAILPAGTVTHSDPAPEGNHPYRLVARNGCGVSEPATTEGGVVPASPGMVTGLTASDSSCSVVRIDWNAPAGAESCRVWRDGEKIASLPASELSYEDFPPPGEHAYQVAARNRCGWSERAAASGRILPAAPVPPASFTASDSSCSVVRLGWQAAAEAERCFLYRGESLIATLDRDVTEYVDRPGPGEHVYRLVAENGCGASSQAEAAGFVSAAPEPPTGIFASDNSCAFVGLIWTAPAWAESVRVYRDGLLLGAVRADHGSYTDGFFSGSYEYGLSAGNRCGWSERATAVGTILPGTPLAPTGLAATADRCDMLVIRWEDNSDDEIRFDILRDRESAGSVGPGETGFVDYPPAGMHEYEVLAVGECGVTSGGFVFGAMLEPPAPPRLLSPEDGASLEGDRPITLAWSPAAEATGCRLQVSSDFDFLDLIFDSTLSAPVAAVTLPFTPPPGPYFWRAASFAPCGEGGFSLSGRFTREPVGEYGLSSREVAFGYDPLGSPAGSDPPEPDPDPVLVRNDGEIGFSWTLSPSDPWIAVEPDAGFLEGGEAETLWIRVLADDVMSGEFDGYLLVNTDLPSGEEDTIRVDLTVKHYPLGDCNGNGNLDERDLAALVDHMRGELPLWSPVLRLGLADVDFDQDVGEKDLNRLPGLIGSSLLRFRPEMEKLAGEEGVLWIGMSGDSALVSLEGNGEVRAGSARFRVSGSPAPVVSVSPIGGDLRAELVQEGRDFVLLWYFPEGDPEVLNGENRIDLLGIAWGDGEEPEFDFAWGGIAPSGFDRYPVSRAEFYRLCGPGSRRFAFYPIRPNPFSEECVVSFELPAAAPVNLKVYDPAGRLVRVLASGEQGPGFHTLLWDGRDHSGRKVGLGLYFVRLESIRGTLVRRSMIVR